MDRADLDDLALITACLRRLGGRHQKVNESFDLLVSALGLVSRDPDKDILGLVEYVTKFENMATAAQ